MENKCKFLVRALFLLVVSVLLTSCVSPSGMAAAADKIKLSWGSNSTATGGYIVAGGIGNAVNAYSSMLDITVEPSSGQGENLRNLKDGLVQFGQGTNDGTYYYYTSTGMYEGIGGTNMRVLFPLPKFVHHILAAEGSGINTLDDIRGKKVAVGTAGSGFYTYSETLLAAMGMTFDDIEPAYLQPGNAMEAMADGQLDAMMYASTVPWGNVTDLCTTTNVRFISVDQKYIDNMRKINPAYNISIIPANTYPGQTEAITTSAQQSMVWTFAESVSEEIVYELVRCVWETRDEWLKVHSSCEELQLKTATDEMVIPLHAGAYKYYKEAGLDIPENLTPPEAR